MNIKALVASLVLSVTAIPAMAEPTYERHDEAQDHIELLNTLSDMGVDVQINNPHICSKERGTAGFWIGARKLFVLCQESIRKSAKPLYTGEVFQASDDDLDTIRHEAHHVIQDCMDGTIDGQLSAYLNPENSVEFLSYYPDWKEEYITKQYRDMGASNHVIEMEIEAWAVADMVSVDMIHEVLKRECKV